MNLESFGGAVATRGSPGGPPLVEHWLFRPKAASITCVALGKIAIGVLLMVGLFICIAVFAA